MDMDAVLSAFKHINLSFFSAQIGTLSGAYQLFGLLVLLFVFLYGISVGRTRAIISLLGIFAGYTLAAFFPFWNALDRVTGGRADPALLRAGIFLISYVVSVVVLNVSSLAYRLSSGEMSFMKVAVISILQVGLLGGIVLSFFSPDAVPAPAAFVRPYLASPLALFIWSVAAIAVLPFVRSHHRRSAPMS